MYLSVPGIEPMSSVWESMLPTRPQWQMCGNFKSGATDKRLTSKAEIIFLSPFLFSFGNLFNSSSDRNLVLSAGEGALYNIDILVFTQEISRQNEVSNGQVGQFFLFFSNAVKIMLTIVLSQDALCHKYKELSFKIATFGYLFICQILMNFQ